MHEAQLRYRNIPACTYIYTLTSTELYPICSLKYMHFQLTPTYNYIHADRYIYTSVRINFIKKGVDHYMHARMTSCGP